MIVHAEAGVSAGANSCDVSQYKGGANYAGD